MEFSISIVSRYVCFFFEFTRSTQNHQNPCFWYLKTTFFGGENLCFSWFWVLMVLCFKEKPELGGEYVLRCVLAWLFLSVVFGFQGF